MELEPIQHILLNHDNDLVDLTLVATTKSADGKATQKSEVIHTNEKHPFLTKEKGFVPVSQLKPGMHVLQANGSYGVVGKLVVVPGAMWMYNLTVTQDHTYTVGMAHWIVHNDDACDGGQKLYRTLRSDENPENGLSPKDPNASKSVFQHIRFGSQPGFQSQFISTTKNLGLALEWATKTGGRIAQIDASKVPSNIIDVSTPEGLAQQGIYSPSPAYSFARSSEEVLIDGSVPSDAIDWVADAEDLASLL